MSDGNRLKTIVGIALAGSALFAAGACGSGDAGFTAAPVGGVDVGLMSSSPSSSDGMQSGGADSGDMASLDKVVAAATGAVQGSSVLSVQAENNGQMWEVQLAAPDGTEQLLEVDASGKVLSEPRAKDTGPEEKARVMSIVKDAKLTFQEAMKKVSKEAPNSKITHMSLDKYGDNLLIWDVDVVGQDGNWQALKINAKDGTVTKGD
ncbi:PepSY domain-containing protein [Streptosporangiaceae bacterium NEAU-GS5]|nr:PepSY domain-containing protein [Streptosporangiaceae bacterium NEAU-GS5]